MYKSYSIIVVICARGGSKGVPGKNIRLLNGKPLITYTIEQAKKFDWADRIVVSTDDGEIKSVAEKCGVNPPFLRPKELATDEISVIPAVIHAVRKAENYWKEQYDIVVNLSPTGPLRIVKDIEAAVKTLVNIPNTESVFSVSESNNNPYFNMYEVDSRGYATLSKRTTKLVTRRQDAPKVYLQNGSIYAMWKREIFGEKDLFERKTRVYVMPEERSVDIDTNLDFEFAEFLMRRVKNENLSAG
ncbi:acylneuraminate cytidylyltransferase family protein [Candidatus Collierbacteria bacterium]|nr:acylneuraminate cytidylyltransferase family protein [Candidatus Collierbacteria bacterium]